MGRPLKKDPTREKLTERVAARIGYSTALQIAQAAVLKGMGEADLVREALALGLAEIGLQASKE